MSKDLIRYDLLAQEALRGMLRKLLQDTAKSGLPGEHHFFITFETQAPGVRLSQRLREQHPEEMTVVIQHQYWDLAVSDTDFEISLSFNGVPEHLKIPFSSIKGFFDPSVSFGLQFDPQGGTDDEDADAPEPEIRAGDNFEISELKPAEADQDIAALHEQTGENDAQSDGDGDGAEVVSLDAFRKKN